MKDSKEKRKVVCIGLDGTTWDVISPWIKEGRLPIFKKLLENGTHGILNSTVPCLTCPALPSLYTGKNPGNTGIFDFSKPDGTLVSINDIDSDFLWDIMERHGLASCVVNLQITYPPQQLNGIMISGGLSAPSEDSDYTYPSELRQEIGEFHSEEIAKRTSILIKDLDGNRHQIYEDRLIQHKTRFKVFKDLISKNAYDFAIYWEGTTDSIQHYCWDHKELILKYFQEIELMIDDLLKSFPESNILVLSDHGFEGYPTHNFNVNTWLKKEGYLKQKGSSIKLSLINMTMDIIKKHIRYKYFLEIWHSLKGKNIQKNKKEENAVLTNYFRFLPGIDWENTRVYLDQSWGISLVKENLNGDYERLREEIISKLTALKDESGNQVVKDAWRREDIFKGRYLDQIPDIVFLTTEKYKTNKTLLREILTDIKEKKPVSGRHDNARNGIFIAHGPDIKKGHMMKSADIVDVAPTILHILNCDVPEDMDGRVMEEIFHKDSESAKREIKYSKPTKSNTKKESAYSKNEEKRVKDKLKDLGYL